MAYQCPIEALAEAVREMLAEAGDRVPHYFGHQFTDETKNRLEIPKYVWGPSGWDPEERHLTQGNGPGKQRSVAAGFWTVSVICHGLTFNQAGAMLQNLIVVGSRLVNAGVQFRDRAVYLPDTILGRGCGFRLPIHVLDQVLDRVVPLDSLIEPNRPEALITSVRSEFNGTASVVEVP